MSKFLKDLEKENTNLGNSGNLLSNDDMKKFIDRTYWLENHGGDVIKNAVNSSLNPFMKSVKEATEGILDVEKNTLNAVRNELPDLIDKAIEKADIKGKIEKSAQSISWELWLLRVIVFIFGTVLSIYALGVLYMKIQEKWSGINNPMIGIAIFIFCTYITFIIGKAVGRNNKFF